MNFQLRRHNVEQGRQRETLDTLFCNILKPWPLLQRGISNSKPNLLTFHVLTSPLLIVFSSYKTLLWQMAVKKRGQPNKESLLNRKENKNWYQIIPLFLSFLFTSFMLYQSVSRLKPHDCFTVTSAHCYTNTLTQPFLRGMLHLCSWHSRGKRQDEL